MIGALHPALLGAGLALAAVAVTLHLLVRRPPDRAPLPTARFLRADVRSRLRLQRRPADPVLLLLRVAFALVLGAAFAGLRWTPEREGVGRAVLLDAAVLAGGSGGDPAGAGGPGEADSASSGGGSASAAPVQRAVDAATSAGEAPIVVVYGVEGGSRSVEPEDLPTLRPAPAGATFEDGLRALRRHLLEETRLASVRVTWVLGDDLAAWTAGFGTLRPALWPGAVELVVVGGDGSAGSPDAGSPAEPVVVAAAGSAPARAAGALGWATDDGPGGTAGTRQVVFAAGGGTGDAPGITRVLPVGRGGAGEPVWTLAARESGGGAVLLPNGVTMEMEAPPVRGTPAAGARVVAVYENGAPAAAARTTDGGCTGASGLPLDDPRVADAPELPWLVEALATACEDDRPAGRLDPGARAVLAGDGPATVALADLGAPDGRSLRTPLLLLALLLLAADVGLARRRSP